MPVAEKEKKSAAKPVVKSGDSAQLDAKGNPITRGVDFLKDVRTEMHKVVTPSKEEVRSTTVVVIVSVFIFAAFFYIVDSIFGRGLQLLLHAMSGH